MTLLWIITGIALIVSFIADRRKTRASLTRGLKMFLGILPTLLGVLAMVSLVLAAMTPEIIQKLFSGSGLLSFFIAIGIGSVALIPGFIAYPLTAILKSNGASIPVLAAFITSLMMVGILTLPMEAKFFGWRVALLRNSLALIGAIIVAAGMAWVLT